MLIDAGNNADGEMIVNFIKEKGITRLKYVIGTHPHEDHIGGLDDVINNLDVENVYLPQITTNTKTFEDVLDAIENKNLKISEAKKGDSIYLGDAKCEFMLDPILEKDNLNLSSLACQITYGNKSFLFMGDAEKENEETRSWQKVNVLKVGHHGSSTSTSQEFLNQIKPEIAVISVGQDNSYGHPDDTIIKRLENIGAKIYQTKDSGTIEIICDGNQIQINTEK